MNKTNSRFVYADNAATTKLSTSALNAMLPYLQDIYGNPSSVYKIGQKAKEALENARRRAASALGCNAGEIVFTSCGSESNNQAIITAANIGKSQGKRHIISSSIEHHSVLNVLKKLESERFNVELLDVSHAGIVAPEQIRDAIRDDTALVTIMYANNEIGTVQPISEIGAICRDRNILFHTDAVQAIGHIPVNIEKDNIDMLSLSAHKFNGPKGAGIFYARKDIPLTNLINGGAQERGKRAGTENLAGIVGMVQALEESINNVEAYSNKLLPLSDYLIDELNKIPNATLNGDREKRLPGTVNFSFAGIDSEMMLIMLDNIGISASAGSACSSGSLEPSHVIKALGTPDNFVKSTLRLSLGNDTTLEDVQYLIESVKTVVEHLRGKS